MTLSYDNEADALAITLADGVVDRTVEIDSGTFVDVDEASLVLTIEVIRPARRWPLEAVLDQFGVSPEDTTMLRAIWGGDETLQVSPLAPLAVA